MTAIEEPIGEKDFYGQLITEIDADHIDQAVTMVIGLPERRSRIEVLSRLAHDLAPSLDIRGASTLDLNRARALLRARDCANDLARAFDAVIDFDHLRALEPVFECARALEVAINRARVLYLHLDRADQINRIIIGGLNDLMDNGRSTTTEITPPPEEHTSKVSRGIMIAVVCIILLVGAAVILMTMQSQSSARYAATSTAQAEQQMTIIATDTVPPK